MTVNLARHRLGDREADLELILHEFAHHDVRSNDHLCKEFTRR